MVINAGDYPIMYRIGESQDPCKLRVSCEDPIAFKINFDRINLKVTGGKIPSIKLN